MICKDNAAAVVEEAAQQLNLKPHTVGQGTDTVRLITLKSCSYAH